jgi:hypothetical protein
MRPLGVSVIASLALVLAGPAHAGIQQADASKSRTCGTYSSTSIYKKAKVVALRRVSCKRALQVAKAYDKTGRTPSKWRCGLAHNAKTRLFSCGAGSKTGPLDDFKYALVVYGVGAKR